jgi:hypothetical protein
MVVFTLPRRGIKLTFMVEFTLPRRGIKLTFMVEFTLPLGGIKLTFMVMYTTDYIGRCKFKYYKIRTTMAFLNYLGILY